MSEDNLEKCMKSIFSSIVTEEKGKSQELISDSKTMDKCIGEYAYR